MKYTRKPEMIEAVHFVDYKIGKIQDFVDEDCIDLDLDRNQYYLKTLNGRDYLFNGDYVVKDSDGNYRTCREEELLHKYERVN